MTGPFDDTAALTPLEDLLNDVVAAANARVQSGTGGSGTLVADTSTPVAIVFSPAYATAPDVVPALRGSPVTGDRVVSLGAVTTTGATINVINKTGTGAVQFTWIAVGPQLPGRGTS